MEQEFILFDIATFGLVLLEDDRQDIQSTLIRNGRLLLLFLNHGDAGVWLTAVVSTSASLLDL